MSHSVFLIIVLFVAGVVYPFAIMVFASRSREIVQSIDDALNHRVTTAECGVGGLSLAGGLCGVTAVRER